MLTCLHVLVVQNQLNRQEISTLSSPTIEIELVSRLILVFIRMDHCSSDNQGLPVET